MAQFTRIVAAAVVLLGTACCDRPESSRGCDRGEVKVILAQSVAQYRTAMGAVPFYRFRMVEREDVQLPVICLGMLLDPRPEVTQWLEELEVHPTRELDLGLVAGLCRRLRAQPQITMKRGRYEGFATVELQHLASQPTTQNRTGE
jgi:hypothetical protein